MSKAIALFEEISKKHGFTREQLCSRRKDDIINAARSEFYERASALGWSSAMIARLIKRDSSTVRKNLRNIKAKKGVHNVQKS